MIPDCSAANLHPFVVGCVEPGSVIHTDGWAGYAGLEKKGYQRQITKIVKRREKPAHLMPRVHRVVSLLKRWLLGTHQGGVGILLPPLLSGRIHLSLQSSEFTFRFNRRKSKSRGKLFFRLVQQAVNTPPKTYDSMLKSVSGRPQPVAAS
jgi:hypothetical protein